MQYSDWSICQNFDGINIFYFDNSNFYSHTSLTISVYMLKYNRPAISRKDVEGCFNLTNCAKDTIFVGDETWCFLTDYSLKACNIYCELVRVERCLLFYADGALFKTPHFWPIIQSLSRMIFVKCSI